MAICDDVTAIWLVQHHADTLSPSVSIKILFFSMKPQNVDYYEQLKCLYNDGWPQGRRLKDSDEHLSQLYRITQLAALVAHEHRLGYQPVCV